MELTIAISGLPGSGSTTLSKNLADSLNLDCFSPGQVFKDISTGKIINQHYFDEFNKLCLNENLILPKFEASNDSYGVDLLWRSDFGKSEKLHKIIDDLQAKLAEKKSIVLDGKLSLHMIKTADIKIWLKASDSERIKRTAQRDNISLEDAKDIVLRRGLIEAEEWKKIYGFDYRNQEELADIVLNTSSLSPKEILDKITSYIKHNL